MCLTLYILYVADMISAVEFDHSGDFLATGDHGGRVVLFERIGLHADDGDIGTHEYEYKYLTEFQSHDPEFDYLKSLEIEEKINQIRWIRKWGDARAHTLLTTNDKTIKLWKVYERKIIELEEFNVYGSEPMDRSPLSPSKIKSRLDLDERIRVPQVQSTVYQLSSKCRKVYPAGHAYHINSISLCSDQETFLSADDLRINLWHFDRPDLSFNIVDIKPEAMEDLTEVITCAEFHSTAPHLFAYGSSKGLIRLGDMRASALCDRHSKLLDGGEKDGSERNFFSEIVVSVNDIKFIGNSGNHILSRDYLTMKVWDIRNESKPVYVHEVHSALRSKLTQLYESDAIFDKFDCCSSRDGRMIATGTYSNLFRVSHCEPGPDTILLESSRDPMRKRMNQQSKFPNRIVGFGRPIPRSTSNSSLAKKRLEPKPDPPIVDFQSKIQHLSWHPTAPVIATAAQNSLYLYFGKDM